MHLKENTLSVPAIKKGTVIDHIRAGQALKIIHLFRLNENRNQVTVGLNLKSPRIGLKDLIKIENVFLSELQAAQIAIFSPLATVNVIENYQLTKKFKVQMPEAVEAVFTCPNSRCITHNEKAETYFWVEENEADVILRCRHCERHFSCDQILGRYEP